MSSEIPTMDIQASGEASNPKENHVFNFKYDISDFFSFLGTIFGLPESS
jgi:hypothetical protein